MALPGYAGLAGGAVGAARLARRAAGTGDLRAGAGSAITTAAAGAVAVGADQPTLPACSADATPAEFERIAASATGTADAADRPGTLGVTAVAAGAARAARRPA